MSFTMGVGSQLIAGRAATLVLFDGRAGEEGGLLVLVLGDLDDGASLGVSAGSQCSPGPVWPVVTFGMDMALASFAWLIT